MDIADIRDRIKKNHAIEASEIIELCNAVERKDVIIDTLTKQIARQNDFIGMPNKD